jgi:hypothetical protein
MLGYFGLSARFTVLGMMVCFGAILHDGLLLAIVHGGPFARSMCWAVVTVGLLWQLG